MQKFHINEYLPPYISYFVERLLPYENQNPEESMKNEVLRIIDKVMNDATSHITWDRKGKKGKILVDPRSRGRHHVTLSESKVEIENEKNSYKNGMIKIFQKIEELNKATGGEDFHEEYMMSEATNIRKEVRVLLYESIKNFIEKYEINTSHFIIKEPIIPFSKHWDDNILDLIDRMLPDYNIMRNKIKNHIITTIDKIIDMAENDSETTDITKTKEQLKAEKKECINKMFEMFREIDDLYFNQKNINKTLEQMNIENINICKKLNILFSQYLQNYDKYYDSYSCDEEVVINLNEANSIFEYYL